MIRKGMVILSGGLDSTALLYYLLSKPHEYKVEACITFAYGQLHTVEILRAKQTISFLKKYLDKDIKHLIIDISSVRKLDEVSALTSDTKVPEGHYEDENMKQTVVASRNLLFLTVASMYAITNKLNFIALGIHQGDHTIYPDCRPAFLKSAEETINLGNWVEKKLLLLSPFLYDNKAHIINKGIQAAKTLRIDPYHIFINTYTCYNGRAEACGKCGSCVERREAFCRNGIEDPIKYEESN